jgi:hypothetical protein
MPALEIRARIRLFVDLLSGVAGVEQQGQGDPTRTLSGGDGCGDSMGVSTSTRALCVLAARLGVRLSASSRFVVNALRIR